MRTTAAFMILSCAFLPIRSDAVITLPLLPDHHVAARRRRQLQKQSMENELPDDEQIDPLYQGFGTHYVDLWVGCPPQRQTVIVDTGSGETAFPCIGCHSCGAAAEDADDPHPEGDHNNHIDPLYHQNESSCFRYLSCDNGEECRFGECVGDGNYGNFQLQQDTLEPPPFADQKDLCRMMMAYAEGSSWYAVESMDRAYMGGSHFEVDQLEEETESFDLAFGCQVSVTGLFETQLADGIAGMMMTDAAYWMQLYHAQKIDKKQFSLCFTRAPTITYGGIGSGAGAMVLGGSDKRLHETPMVYAALAHRGQMFDVTIQRVYLRMNGGGSVVTENGSGNEVISKTVGEAGSETAIVDSGSTNSYLPGRLQKAFQDVWKELTGMEYEMGKEYTFENETDLDALLPTVLLDLKAWKDPDGNDDDDDDTIQVAFPPSHYMRYYKSTNAYKAKLLFRGRYSNPSLGANFLQGKDALFDAEHRRLGFAESHCDYLSMGAGFDRFNHSIEAFKAAYQRSQGEDESTEGESPSIDKIPEEGMASPHLVILFFLAGLLAVGTVWRFNKVKSDANEEERIALGMEEDFHGTEMVMT